MWVRLPPPAPHFVNRIREATKYGKCSDAIEFLKKRASDGLTGKIVLSNQVTFDDLKNLIVNDYRNNGRKSLPHLEQVRLPKLSDVFAGMKTIDITTAAVERYPISVSSIYDALYSIITLTYDALWRIINP